MFKVAIVNRSDFTNLTIVRWIISMYSSVHMSLNVSHVSGTLFIASPK